MDVRTGWVVVIGIALVSGCASQRQSQVLNRVQADVQLLDQRVAQLERGSVAQVSSSSWPSESSASAPTIEPIAVSIGSSLSPTSSAKPTAKQIQQALRNAGLYQGEIDGKLGSQSRSAIREFQRANGLSVDGKVGKQTWGKLSAYASSSGETALSAAEPIK